MISSFKETMNWLWDGWDEGWLAGAFDDKFDFEEGQGSRKKAFDEASSSNRLWDVNRVHNEDTQD
jgi:hypothetical protein